jgi:hypothetical protein
MDLQGFFLAIFADWVALMSGIASVALTILGVVRKWDALPRRALWVAALICFFFAAARVWTAEHRARLTSEKHLEELTTPKLSGAISFVSVSPTGDETDSIVMVGATIKNTGAPSIADELSMRIRLNSGQEIPLVPLSRPPKNIELHLDRASQPDVTLLKEDYLPLKTKSQPIVTGGAAEGWTWGLAKGAKKAEVIKPGTTIILSFKDVREKNWEITKIITGEGADLIDPSLLQKKP